MTLMSEKYGISSSYRLILFPRCYRLNKLKEGETR